MPTVGGVGRSGFKAEALLPQSEALRFPAESGSIDFIMGFLTIILDLRRWAWPVLRDIFPVALGTAHRGVV